MPARERPAATLVWMRDRDRGVRPALSEEKIVRAAVDLADAEGIDALSMRRIATELGSGTTSLYRHITGKDELIELMVDAVYGERPMPPGPGDDWRAGLAAVARSFRASLLRHPWLAQQASRRPALGPNVIARFDHALAVVDRFTHDATRANMIVSAVNTYVLGSVAAELADREAQRSTGMTEDEWRDSVGTYVGHVVDSGRYPHFNRRILNAEDPDADARFEFGLDCLLSGIASGAGAL
ncbi:TetR/AcrR family transcriptional regulator [Pseudonocardia sp.]|jgi:AcrR family transcriptional regulator|uniref:TetR/AcrR family transcriptional regulator n=1 Tax=Pseudonocardia sp. TaxID=60912 RepID=UPI0031FC4CCC